MTENKKAPQDVRGRGECELQGQIIILDSEQEVIAIISSECVIEKKGYQVIIDTDNKYQFIPRE